MVCPNILIGLVFSEKNYLRQKLDIFSQTGFKVILFRRFNKKNLVKFSKDSWQNELVLVSF